MTIPLPSPETSPQPIQQRIPRASAPARSLAEVADAAVRLQLLDRPDGPHPLLQQTLDGGWWPHTRELTLELPLLVAAFAERGVRITRVIYHPSLWLIAPPKLRLDGRVVHLGWLRDIDPNLVSLRTSQDTGIELLVVPPEASAELAGRAMAAAAEPGNTTAPAEILQAAGA
jgi:hypothetical protein